jgi:hypothetical protein
MRRTLSFAIERLPYNAVTGAGAYTPERRQCGGLRPFKRSGLNSRFVPKADIRDAE